MFEKRNNMFEKIGKKIKTLAKVYCWIGIIGSVIGGIVTWALIDDEIGGLFFLLIAVVGSLLSWISCIILYGFGELVDKTCDIECIVRGDIHVDSPDSTESKAHKLLSKELITAEEYEKIANKERS